MQLDNPMRTIPRSTHGILDYTFGALLLVSPLILSFPDGPTKGIAVVFGAVIVLYSIFTDYEMALLRVLPFPFHRALDLLWGLGMLFSPIHFAINGAPSILFVILGLGAVLLAFLTRGQPEENDRPLAPGMK